MPGATPTRRRRRFGQVVLATGHMVDRPGRPAPRFPPSGVPAVTRAIAALFRTWHVGPGTLVLSGGARGSDIVAAEQGLALGAEVWLLIPLPDDQFVAASVSVPGTDWEERYRRLRDRCPTWFQAGELGPPAAGEDAFERNNDWCVAVARAQAASSPWRVLAVWDGGPGDGPGGTGHLLERARALGASVEVIRPPAATTAGMAPGEGEE